MRYILALVLLFLTTNVYAVCDPTLMVCESGCDYDTLNAAVTDLETNCASPTEPLSIEISGSWSAVDETPVTISGISTTSSNTLTIYTTGDARHNGIESSVSGRSNYILKPSTSNALDISNSHIIIDGLEIDGTNATDHLLEFGSFANITVKNNIIRDLSAYDKDGIATSASGPFYVYNNIMYNITGTFADGIDVNTTGQVVQLYNNTIYNITRDGIDGINSSNLTCSNNIIMGTTTSFDRIANVTGNNNMCDDTNCEDADFGSGSSNVTSETTGEFVSVIGGSEDLHLASDADAIDAGADLSGTFTTDIDGDTRTGTWDIGADEYQATAASTPVFGGTTVYGTFNNFYIN